ncbi:MAG: hypothetical protein DMF10_11345 [Verrucomicrobia bacterium]|nr:MAG: hypothetical protein DMF10_11345 [Verrucomicrobiota bacterium]PYI47438.1 MAG: hypothetical protein DMF11_06235 [Verrucomicrobiota bacterium]
MRRVEGRSRKSRCHVERSETLLIYFFRPNLTQNSSEILRSAQNDIFLVRSGDLDFGFPTLD